MEINRLPPRKRSVLRVEVEGYYSGKVAMEALFNLGWVHYKQSGGDGFTILGVRVIEEEGDDA